MSSRDYSIESNIDISDAESNLDYLKQVLPQVYGMNENEFYQLGKEDQELAMDLLENGTQYLYNSAINIVNYNLLQASKNDRNYCF